MPWPISLHLTPGASEKWCLCGQQRSIPFSHQDVQDGPLSPRLSAVTQRFRSRRLCCLSSSTVHVPPHSSMAPLFICEDGSYLTPTGLTATLRSLLNSLGYLESNYVGHSFRIGATTTAAAAGLPVWLIKTLGQWSSDFYDRYIRTDSRTLRRVPNTLANTSVSSMFPPWNPDSC